MPALRVLSLYPELMNIYADRGNIAVLRARCEWRGIGFEHAASTLGESFDPDAHDHDGIAVLRAAAADHEHVAAVSSPTQYASVLRDIKRDQAVAPETRHKLAAEAFGLIAALDAQFATELNH